MSEVFNPAVDNSGEPAVTDRVPVGSDMYNRIVEFLYDEAALLDNLQLNEWAKCFTEDIVYQAPVKVTQPARTRRRKDGP